MKKNSSSAIWIIILLIVALCAISFNLKSMNKGTMSYSEFEQKWKDDEIKSLSYNESDMIISGVTTDNKEFSTVALKESLVSLMDQNPKSDINVKFEAPSNGTFWLTIVSIVLTLLVGGFIIFIFIQQSQAGGAGRSAMNFGKSRAKLADPDAQKVTFKDVAGADEEKDELAEIVDYLKEPTKYIDMGARIPKGILLVGPPGTGKTLLAKAIAGEAKVPFFTISGSDFVEMFVGVGASRVRDLFSEAKKNAPCIIFVDEIDAVGRQRGAGLGGGHDEREQTLNQLLVEMDGFGVNEGIIMIAATNRPDILDPALLRPGRFDRQIVVGAPDVKGREEILKVHTRTKPLAEDVDLKILAKRTPGFCGADLENLANESALLAVRKKEKQITMADMEEAITRVIAGTEKKSKVITEKDKKITAYHEAGHAVAMNCLEYADPVHEISIIPRGRAGGYTMHLPDHDTMYSSKNKLKDEMVGLLAGRIAEKIIFDDITTGAKNDIDRASSIAKSMVMEYGMSDKIGTISYSTEPSGEVFLGRDLGKGRDFSESLGAIIDSEVKGFIDEAYSRAEKILKDNINSLHAVAKALIENEKIEREEFLKVFNSAKDSNLNLQKHSSVDINNDNE